MAAFLCLFDPRDEGITLLGNVGNYLPIKTV
jgi:hypothetical protein